MTRRNHNYIAGVAAAILILANTTSASAESAANVSCSASSIHTTQDLKLPNAPTPVGAYEAGIIRQGVGFVSGQFPIREGKLVYTGKVGDELTTEQAHEAAEIAALNVLAHIYNLTDGFERLDGLLRVEGYVTSAPGFHNQAAVLNGASNLFKKYLGEKGRHARAAFSVSQLPLNSPLELVVSFAVCE